MSLTNEDLPKLVELLNLIDIRVKVRRKTAAGWTSSNEVLLSGEWGKETDTGKMKQGDGTTAWNSLPYFAADSALQIQSLTSNAFITPLHNDDLVDVTALATDTTINNPSGTAENGDGFFLRVKDNGTSRGLTWGSKYRAVGGTLPTASVVSEWLYLPVSYNPTDDKWDVFFDQVGSGSVSYNVQSFISTSTVTPVCTDDLITISAQAAGLTVNEPTGSPVAGQGFLIQLKDNGTTRSITWDAAFVGIGDSLPTATTAGKWMYIPVVYNAAATAWHVILPATVQT